MLEGEEEGEEAERYAFAFNDDGSVKYLLSGDTSFHPVAWYRRTYVNIFYLYSMGALVILSFLVWPLAEWIYRKRKKRKFTVFETRARNLSLLASVIVLFIVGVIDAHFVETRVDESFLGGIPILFKSAIIGGWLLFPLVLGQFYYLIQALRKKFWGKYLRVYYSLMSFLFFSFILFMGIWNWWIW